jgi:hypothetical protein
VLGKAGPTLMVQTSSMGALFFSIYLAIAIILPMEDERTHGISEQVVASLPYKIETYIFFKVLSSVMLSSIFISIYVLLIFAFTRDMAAGFWSYAIIFFSALPSAVAMASFLIILTILLSKKWKQPIMFLMIVFTISSPMFIRTEVPIALPYIMATVFFTLAIFLYLVFRGSLTEKLIAQD